MANVHRRSFQWLGSIYLALWVALALAPRDRSTWLLENALTVVVGLTLFLSRKKLPFSRFSYSLWFAFLVLHAIGGHFTYAEVPYDSLCSRISGWSPNEALGWKRNNYDRIVHFGFGLLLAYPSREIALRVADVRGFWGYFIPFLLVVAASAIFELLEWFAVVVFDDRLGMTYLATQGDPWDAQKDMGLATLGATIAMGLNAAFNWRMQRDFAREWSESVRVKHKQPL